MSIAIQPELESILRRRAQAAGSSVEAYLERIARDDEAADGEWERLALEGLASGPSIEAADEYWDRKRRRLMDRRDRPRASS